MPVVEAHLRRLGPAFQTLTEQCAKSAAGIGLGWETTSGFAREVRNNAHSYRNWGTGRSNAPAYLARKQPLASHSF